MAAQKVIKWEKTVFVKVIHFDILEICGDGLNLMTFECDDGNLLDGDGCSSDCKVESGYKCYIQEDKPDICRDIVPPYATLEVYRGNILTISFNEKVISLVPSKVIDYIGYEIINYLEITIEGITIDTEVLSWNLVETFDPFKEFIRLTIEPSIESTILGNNEKFKVKFLNKSIIQDIGNNQLKTEILIAPALRKV